MFGELLERNMPLLGCLENCWIATCHCCSVWSIAGMQYVIVMFGELLERNISLL